MHLDTEFVRLPLRVDAARLASELSWIAESAWRPHPQGYPGNSALPLIAVQGDPENDDVSGQMLPTPHLAELPYLQQVLRALGAVIGRTRLMRLEGDAEALSHSDINYYWYARARVHVPIVTHPDVMFHCGRRALHMAAGEVWIFDTWQTHRVTNPRPTQRIHLVADTVGSADFWSLVEGGDAVFAPNRRAPAPDCNVPFVPGQVPELAYESWNWPRVMAPAELDAVADQIRRALPAAHTQSSAVERGLTSLTREWRALWARHGDEPSRLAAYADTRTRFAAQLAEAAAGVTLNNGSDAVRTLRELLLRPALQEATAAHMDAPAQSATVGSVQAKPARATRPAHPSFRSSRFERPVFIVCPPRSGSTLLFETLQKSPDLWTIGGESHQVIEGIAELHPAHAGFASNRLTASDAQPAIVAQLEAGFLSHLRDREQRPAPGNARVRLLEKTPKNALRIPFLQAAFPDARFVYLYRDARETLSSMLDAWGSGRFVTYPQLPGWRGPAWSLLLTPGWRALAGKPLFEIVAEQWGAATRQLLEDLDALDPARWCVARYERLVADPSAEVARLCEFLEIRWDRPLDGPLPHSRTTLTVPVPEKWRKHEAELARMLPLVSDVVERAQTLATRTVGAVARGPAVAPATPTHASDKPDFRSVYTQSFTQLLTQLGATLVVTTYQSGRVILVRADGDTLNTHLRGFPSPMGVALGRGSLALGTQREVWEFHDVPELAPRLADKPGKRAPDAVFVPRQCNVTGDIRIHEIAYAGGELWLANTRFSALCTLDRAHSFVPRWQPPFVTALTPEDRCHLNGLCVVDDRVRFVSVLGQTDSAGGWRANKASGGAILEVPTGKVVARGLSMPHSPRWYNGSLWVLESGKGELGRVDLERGSVEPVAQLDGFTRGLAFAGPFAFVGLSQVRESNTFGQLPLTERLSERECGVWVVDLRNGKTVAFLRFEGSVQEIFDVQILNSARYADLLEPGDELLMSTYSLPRGQGTSGR